LSKVWVKKFLMMLCFAAIVEQRLFKQVKTPIDSNPTSSKSTTASQINNERIVSEHMKPETEKTSKPESVTKKRDLKDKLIIMLILIVSVLVLLIVFSSIKKRKNIGSGFFNIYFK
jgi:hypothetical protein